MCVFVCLNLDKRTVLQRTACTPAYMQQLTYMYASNQYFAFPQPCTYIHLYRYIHIYICIHTYIHTYIYISVYIHIHTYEYLALFPESVSFSLDKGKLLQQFGTHASILIFQLHSRTLGVFQSFHQLFHLFPIPTRHTHNHTRVRTHTHTHTHTHKRNQQLPPKQQHENTHPRERERERDCPRNNNTRIHIQPIHHCRPIKPNAHSQKKLCANKEKNRKNNIGKNAQTLRSRICSFSTCHSNRNHAHNTAFSRASAEAPSSPRIILLMKILERQLYT